VRDGIHAEARRLGEFLGAEGEVLVSTRPE
jgi:hypothetical protein